jgi:cell wall-associated NlpC family hydrolase
VANAFRQQGPAPEGKWTSAWDTVNGDENFDLVLHDTDEWVTSAPRGALIFFGQGLDEDGHVGIYLGDGEIVHAFGNKGVCISYCAGINTLEDNYIGWAYPPERWRP